MTGRTDDAHKGTTTMIPELTPQAMAAAGIDPAEVTQESDDTWEYCSEDGTVCVVFGARSPGSGWFVVVERLDHGNPDGWTEITPAATWPVGRLTSMLRTADAMISMASSYPGRIEALFDRSECTSR